MGVEGQGKGTTSKEVDGVISKMKKQIKDRGRSSYLWGTPVHTQTERVTTEWSTEVGPCIIHGYL